MALFGDQESMGAPWECAKLPWEREAAKDAGDADPYADVTEDDASEELAQMLIFLKQSHTITAKHTCCLAWWAARAGVKGTVAKLARRPDSENFSRHFDAVLRKLDPSVHAADHYEALVPCHRRADASQSAMWVPTLLPLEAVEAELAETSSLADGMQKALVENRCHSSTMITRR